MTQGKSGAAAGTVAAPNYSRIVSALKVALPLAALAIFLTVVIYSMLFRPDSSLVISYSSIETSDGEILMTDPRLVGTDREKRPFELLAKAARQDPNAQSLVNLEGIDARMGFIEEGVDVRLEAMRGLLDTDNQILRLDGTIRLTSSSGYVIETDAALADLKNGKLSGDQPIRAEGPDGIISADSFEADRQAKTLKFRKNVKILVVPATEKAP